MAAKKKVAKKTPRKKAKGATRKKKRTDKEITAEYGALLRVLRNARGLSVRKLTAMSGVASASIVRIENGDTIPQITTVDKLLRAMEIGTVTEVLLAFEAPLAVPGMMRKIADYLDKALPLISRVSTLDLGDI